MDRSSKVTMKDVLDRSGLHPKILDFAMFNGYRFGHDDQSLDEQVAKLRERHPEMDHNDALTFIGRGINDDVADFFNQKFPVVGRNVA